MVCAWEKLHWIATSEPGGNATIKLSDKKDEVILEWPDGSVSSLYWHYDSQRWVVSGCIDKVPCDVAARDSL
jgi:hypothetical protein